jgi:hypothetical protein
VRSEVMKRPPSPFGDFGGLLVLDKKLILKNFEVTGAGVDSAWEQKKT